MKAWACTLMCTARLVKPSNSTDQLELRISSLVIQMYGPSLRKTLVACSSDGDLNFVDLHHHTLFHNFICIIAAHFSANFHLKKISPLRALSLCSMRPSCTSSSNSIHALWHQECAIPSCIKSGSTNLSQR